MRRSLFLALTLVVLCPLALCQTTSLTINVTDAGSQSWNNGTYTATLTAQGGGQVQFLLSGVVMTPSQIVVSGTLNGSGSATFSLSQNASITPLNSYWVINVCPQATAKCFNAPTTVSGTTQTFNIIPPAIVVTLANPPYSATAYADSEVTGAVIGSVYFNLTNSVQRICLAVSGSSCTSWTSPVSGTAVDATNLVGPGSVTGNYTHSGVETFAQTIVGSINNAATATSATSATTATNLAGPGSVTGDYTHSGSESFSQTITGSISGNAATATLATAATNLTGPGAVTGNYTHSGQEYFQYLNSMRFADEFSGADWAAKANAADADCGANPCTIWVTSDIAGTATTTWTPTSRHQYIFDAGSWTSSASPMMSVAAGTQSLSIRGAGDRVTRFISSSATADFFQFNGTSGSNINDITVHDMSFETTITRTGGSVFHLIWVQPQAQFYNIRAISHYNYVFCDTGCGTASFYNTENTLEAQGGTEFLIDPGASGGNLTIGPNITADIGASGSTAIGINWLSGNGLFIAPQVDIVRHQNCLLGNPSSGTITGGFFTQLVCDTSNGIGIQLGAGAGNAQSMSFDNSWAATTQGNFANIDFAANANDIRWTGGRIVNGTGPGATVEGGNIYIHDSTIAGNSTGSSGTYNGVTVAANVGGFSFVGNRCGQTGFYSNTQNYGILVSSGGGDNYTIEGNDCNTNVTGGISDGGTGNNKWIFGNLPAATSNSSQPVLAASLTTASGADNVTVTGMTSSGHCSVTATNAGAAAMTGVYVSAKTTNQITVTHSGTTGGTFDVLCTPN